MPTASDTKSNTKRASERKGPITKVGNLTRIPELRYGASGTAYASFGLAVNRPKVHGDWSGERVTDFYEVTCFRSLAENVAECLAKGDRVVVEGDAELDHWNDSDGKKRTTKRILANAVGAELRFASVEIHEMTSRSAPRATDRDVGGYPDADEPF